jgi:MFS family permease
VGVREVLRIRDFRRLWTARLVSGMGSWLLTVAVPAHVYQLTGSLLATGTTLAAEHLPRLLFGPVAGVLADRWDRRRVMVGADLFRAAAVALLLLATGPGALWLLYVALAAESTGTVLFRPAVQATTPAVVGTGRLLAAATSLTALTDGTVRLVGPPAGAALLALTGFPVLVLADVASYLLSALATAGMAARARPAPAAGTVGGVLAGLPEGLRFLRGHRVAHGLLWLSFVFLLGNALLSAVLVPFGIDRLGGVTPVGLVVSALGVGFLLGALPIRLLVDRVPPRSLLALAQLGTAGGFGLLFASTTLAMALPAAVLIGVFGSTTLAVPQVVLQRVVPDAVLGRIGAVFVTAEALATLVGSVAGPALAAASSVPAVAVVACALTAAGALATLLVLPEIPGWVSRSGRR